jgi:hypothetical protein
MSNLNEYNCDANTAMQWRALGFSAAQANEAIARGLSPMQAATALQQQQSRQQAPQPKRNSWGWGRREEY